jgi:hypothetical protein
MPQPLYDTVATPAALEALPIRLAQHSSSASALIMLALLVPALLLTALVPLGLLAASATPALDIAADHPGDAAQALIGLAISLALFGVPAGRAVRRLGCGRSILIDAAMVTVTDTGPFAARVWQAPLSEFRGLTHLVRATLSGSRHELILVHPDRRRSLLLCAADRISQSTVDAASALMRLPEIPAGELYRVGLRREPPTAKAPTHTIAPVAPSA